MIDPDVIVPGHCTGWNAIQTVAAALPTAFMQSNVGTSFMFGDHPAPAEAL